jgi:[acyl-carrier-protein] S-malonyltransferase
MLSLAVVFPGQGSQHTGMGRDWLAHPAALEVFDAADRALRFPLSALCFDGPEEELRLTENTQPAILATSYAIYRAAREALAARDLVLAPAYFAGHSLGEYTALVAAGALDLADALSTVRERGRLMQQAVPVGQGAMAAVSGLDPALIGAVNRDVASRLNAVLDIANYNSPEQTVVSGHAQAVAEALPLYTAAGAKRVTELPVSAPFHSTLMAPAADGLKPLLQALPFSATHVPVISNLAVQPYPADPVQYPLFLHAQIFNPVRWVETVQYFVAQGVTHVLEVGPGKVLRLLAVKTSRELKTLNIELEADLEALAAWLGAAGAA